MVVQRNRSFAAGHNCGRRQRAHEYLQICFQCCEAAHVRYAVLPVLVSAQLLVFLLGDFDLIISARAQYCLVRGCVTARSHHCLYDMSYGSRTHAPRWEYMYVWLLHVILRFWERCTVGQFNRLSRARNGNEQTARPHGRMPPSHRRLAISNLLTLSLDRGEPATRK